MSGWGDGVRYSYMVTPRGGARVTKRRVPIDRLLAWAYQEEIPKRDLSAGEGGTYGYARLIELGTRIDEPDVAYQGYAYIGAPHPDALKIEEAVSQVGDIKVEWDPDLLMGPWRWMLDGEYDGEGHGYYAKTLRGCAKVVNAQGWVVSCAARGRSPYWHDEPPHCAPYWVKPEGTAGRPSAVVVGKRITGHKGRHSWTWWSYCPVRWAPGPTEMALDRAEYVGWWRALVGLQAALRGSLSEHEPIAPAAPERPWVHEPAKVTVFPIGKVTTRPLRLKPERPVAASAPPRSRVKLQPQC